MNCEQLQGHYDLYAIGLAEEPERREIQAHVDRGCAVCTSELKRARGLAALLSAAAPPAEAPLKLRRRILASVAAERSHLRWWVPLWAVATAVAVFAALFFNAREKQFATLLAGARLQLRDQTIELARLNEAFAILNAPDTRDISFGQGPSQPPKGKVFVNPAQGVVLVASNLPPARSGKIYEMWLLPKGRMPMPAGLFQSAMDGTALYIRRGPVDLNATSGVAVTLENEGGAPQPTTQPIIVAMIPGGAPVAR